MSKFVIHPVWPVKSLQQIEYGLYLIVDGAERELSRSRSLDQVERLRRRLSRHRHS